MRLLQTLVTTCLLLFCVPSLAASSDDRKTLAHQTSYKRIEKLVAAEFAKNGRGGLTIGIVDNGALVWSHYYGYANEAERIRTTSTTVYPVESVTKMFTGLMLLQLVESGKVHLTDPVELYVPELRDISNPYPWTPPVTLIQLATMTAGFGRGGCSQTWTLLRYEYEPGTQREYSNLGYCILGLALSRAAGRPFREHVQNEILTPLAMTETGYAATPQITKRLARGYVPGSSWSNIISTEDSESDFAQSAGGLLSTLEDLAKLMHFQLGLGPNSVLPLSSLQASYQMIVPSDGDLRYGDGIGFSAARDLDSQLTALGHGGSIRGFVTSYEFDLSTQSGVILLANSSGGRATYKPLVRKILALLHSKSSGGTGQPATEVH
jgi:CubicO group peptidase (beta-lactamase class C family)